MSDRTDVISQTSREFSNFARSEYPGLVGALCVLLGDPWLAQDVAQEALARAWARWSRVGSLERPDLRAKRVAVNLARSRWRRQKVAARAEALGAASTHPIPEPNAAQEALREAIRRLPARQRAAIALRYFDGMTTAEAAHTMGCKEGTVSALTSQAITSLRKGLVVRGEVNNG